MVVIFFLMKQDNQGSWLWGPHWMLSEGAMYDSFLCCAGPQH